MNPETHLLASWVIRAKTTDNERDCRQGQWPLDHWFNRYLSVALLGWAFCLAVQRGYSFVGVFSRCLDLVFVQLLRKWRGSLPAWWNRRRTSGLDAG